MGSETIADGNLKAHVYGTTTADGYGEIAEAMIRYYFAVISPTASPIPITIDAAAQASGAGSYHAEASVDLFGAQNLSLAYARSCKAITNCPFNQIPNGGGKTSLMALPNSIYTIQLYTNGRVGNPNSAFDAWADPIIAFAEGFDVPDGAYIQLSANVLPAMPDAPPGVPEPAAWALMILGLGAAGATLRRQRATPA